jgi:3D (Asp-Asp-Asp) domain-containing protein
MRRFTFARTLRAIPRAAGLVFLVGQAACAWGSGKNWVNEPGNSEDMRPPSSGSNAMPLDPEGRRVRTIGEKPPPPKQEAAPRAKVGGTPLGTFRNTYYDFPSERDFSGDKVKLMSASCAPIAEVPHAFYDAVCVQGSGKLAAGATVSFAKRDCGCAVECARTGQHICFEQLDSTRFPFGRGASGVAIRPLVSVAADTKVIPLGTIIYVQEFDGMTLPGDPAPHDGCFVVEDRGGSVKGEHIDIFTGTPDVTREVNKKLPSNQGVTVLRDVQKCQRLAQS